MKKIWLLTTLLIGSLLLAGCNTNYLTQNEPSENRNQLSVMENSSQTTDISLREKLLNQFEWVDIASLDKDEQYIFDMIKYPLCEQPEVYGNPRLKRKKHEIMLMDMDEYFHIDIHMIKKLMKFYY